MTIIHRIFRVVPSIAPQSQLTVLSVEFCRVPKANEEAFE